MSNIIKICAFNNKGISNFQDFLNKTRESEILHKELLYPDRSWLSDASFLEHSFDAEIDLNSEFENRYDFARYLVDSFGNLFDDELYDDHGLWTWLALAYFDQLRNKILKKHGDLEYATYEPHHYIPHKWEKVKGISLWYRHSVSMPFRLVKMFSENAKFFISKNGMSAMGDTIEQTVSRPDIFRSSKMLEVIFSLYTGSDGYRARGALNYTTIKKAKEGNTSGYGKMRRLFGDAIPRIKLTHDFDWMEVDEIIDICGEEFLSQV